ncbi:MAG: 30S ribosomal protein S20 [Alphaproteobacteria bacterium]|nr:30S ribosomal protein S20 [Alphaproteobacteria bacterium]
MATHKSAEKRARQSVKLQAKNRARKSRVHTATRKVEEAVTKKDYAAATAALRAAQPEIARAASKGMLPKKRAARKMSRLSARIKKLKQA